MAYTTETIVREESSFKDDTKILDAYVERAIAQADAVIDGKVGQMYVLPLASTPTLVQHISTQLAIYFLLADQNLNLEVAKGVDINEATEAAMKLLDKIAGGDLKLFDGNGDEFTIRSHRKPSGYPNQTSTDAEDTEALLPLDEDY